MKNLLVPCDFSKTAINAFRFALSLAEQSHGTITLMHAIELPVITDPMLLPMADFEVSYKNEMKEKATTAFATMIKEHNRNDVPVKGVVTFGLPTPTILQYAEENSFDLIVMGSHGTSGFRDNLIGSNAEKVVRLSPIPVLIIKDLFIGPIRNIVFPSDLDTAKNDELVERVKQLQRFFKAHLQVVWINTPENFTQDVITRKLLFNFSRHYELKDFTLNIFNDYDEQEGIISFANFVDAELIVMATHGRKGIYQLFQNSIAESVVNRSPKMVWTLSLKRVAAHA
jgi:nucleotide-binding universal stress UspA family protein